MVTIKILVTGVTGQLGYDVVQELTKRNIECLGTSSKDFDIRDAAATLKFIETYAPDAVVHCAAYTAVDKAEDEPALCMKINEAGTRNIALVCKKINAKMVYLSTDYVFPGIGSWYHDIETATAPLNVYGKSKLAGEKVVQDILEAYFIVRVSWVFGKNGSNFVKSMLQLAQDHTELSIVGDQIGSPTYTVDLAILLCDMIATEAYGIYHAANEGICSWAEFAEEIFRLADRPVHVTAIQSSDYHTKALRPLNSRLEKGKLVQAGFHRLPVWQDAVKRYLES